MPVRAREMRPDRFARGNRFVGHDRPFGQERAQSPADGACRERFAAGKTGPRRRPQRRQRGARAQLLGQPFERAGAILVLGRQHIEGAGGRRQRASHAGITEERDGRLGFHQDQSLEVREQRLRRLGEVGNALRGGDIAAAGHPGCVPVGEDSHSCGGAQAVGRAKTALLKRRAAEKQSDRSGRSATRARCRGLARWPAADPPAGARRARLACLAPGEIGGHNQGRHFPGGPSAAATAADAASPMPTARQRPHPARNWARESLDIGRQGSVVAQVLRGMLAHDVDYRRARLARVVEIRSALARPGPRCSRVAAGLPAMRA